MVVVGLLSVVVGFRVVVVVACWVVVRFVVVVSCVLVVRSTNISTISVGKYPTVVVGLIVVVVVVVVVVGLLVVFLCGRQDWSVADWRLKACIMVRSRDTPS